MKRKKSLKKFLFNFLYSKYEIKNRIGLILFLIFLMIILLSFDFYNREFQSWKSIDNNLNIFFLINLNIILLITVTSLLLRNLIKLVYERKRRRLGFRLKSKLTVAFVVIATLPTILFYIIANGFLTNSLNFWFQGQYSVALKDTANVIKNFSDNWNENLKHFVYVISEEIKINHIQKDNSKWFHKNLHRYRLDGLVLYDKKLSPVNYWFVSSKKQQLWKPLSVDKFKKILTTKSFYFDQKIENGALYRAFAPVRIQQNDYYLEVVLILPGAWYSDLKNARKHLSDYENLATLKSPMQIHYQTYLLIITLLLIFASTWFGLYLARNIVIPIETLVEGTQRIAKGDLDFQVKLQANDEIGMLLGSFDIMTQELRRNRIKLAKNREELVDINKQLEERNSFVELVLQTIRTGVLSIDNSGYTNTINLYMAELFQLSQKDLVGKHYRSVLNKDLIVLFNRLNKELEKSTASFISDNFIIQQNKKTIHIQMHLFRFINPDGIQVGKLLVVEDMSELDRLTRAQAWREVARRIAHEIKNPLTPIKLSAQRIRRKYINEIEDMTLLDKCTTTIINEVDLLKNMVNEFSKFARLPEISPTMGHLHLVIKEVYNLFITLPSNIELVLDLDDHLPQMLFDRQQMKRVFINLIDNAIAAIKSTVQKGQITVKTSYANKIKLASIYVIDNGCGISEEIIDRIFDPYITMKKGGTGLGLAIVQQIVNDHGGYIRLEKNQPQGTIFIIELQV